MQYAVCVLLVALLSGRALGGSRPVRKSSSPGGCRCMANQWEGSMITTQREFSWAEARTDHRESTKTISYDYVNRLLVEAEEDAGFKLISDYKTGLEYRVESDGSCRLTKIYSPMDRMCIPDNAIAVSEYRIGLDNSVTVWQADRPGNHSHRMTVFKKLCIPLSEESLSIDEEYAVQFTTVYANVTFGIRDESVFHPPKDCVSNKEFDRIAHIRAMAMQLDREGQ